jgi:hypothetical protein
VASTEFFGALQGRHEQGVGAGGADAEVVHLWPHLEPPRGRILLLHNRSTTFLR